MVMEFVLELFFTGCLSVFLAFLFVKFVSSVGAIEVEQEKCSTVVKTEYMRIEEDHHTNLDEVDVMQEEQRLVKHETGSETKICEFVQEEDEGEGKAEFFTRCQANLVDEATTSTSALDNEANELIELEEKTEDDKDEEDEKTENDKDDEEDDDDDWEGIERSEVEKHFSCASKFVHSSDGKNLVSQLSNEVQKQLYGLHRVAMEGPCRGMPPMALMVTARSKWHAWQQLGNMTPDVAMELYVNLLSDAFPGWAGENHKHDIEPGEGNPETEDSFTNTDDSLSLNLKPNLTSERVPEEPQSLGESCDAKTL